MTAAPALIMLIVMQPPAEAPRRAAPERPMTELFSTDDYPRGALVRGAEGTVGFLLEIGSDGSVRDCRIEASSGDADLDRATCELVRGRARFRPAADRQGRPSPDRWRSTVIWRIRDDRWPADQPVRLVTIFSADARGEISCSRTMNGGPTDPPFGGSCDFPEAAAVLGPLGREHRAARLTQLISVAPAGSALAAAGDGIDGELLYEWEGRLSVAPDGTVVECRTTSRLGHRGNFAALGAPDVCAGYSGRAGFRPAGSGGQVRILHARHALYQRIGEGE